VKRSKPLKRTAGLRRGRPRPHGTGLKPGKPLKRTGRLQARKVPKAFRARRDTVYSDWVRQHSCLLVIWQLAGLTTRRDHACWGPVQVCHVRSRGAGGDDRGNLVPLCAGAHEEQHRIGIRSFQARWGIDLTAEAARLWAQYQRETGAP